MDDIHLMTVFVAVGEEQSLAGGARRLDISAAAAMRAINHLESKMGVAFFQRNTRGLALTESGQRYLEDSRAVLQLVERAEASVIGANIVARGQLRITAPTVFGRLFIIPLIKDYLALYPEMEISAIFLDRTVNLIDEGFDVAIRIAELPDSGMKALKVGQVRRLSYASPAYLEKHGEPVHPMDLQKHRIIAAEVPAQVAVWKFRSKDSALSVKLRPVLDVIGSDAAIDAAVRGIGIVNLPCYQVAEKVRSGELRAILVDYASGSLPIHLLHRESRFGSSRVRSFIDLVGPRLRKEIAAL